MANTNKKSSNKKKLVSALSMLTVSAVMLSTATYAWFTMNKEVEVKSIQMTATVPEDLQLSLGAVTDGTLQAGTGTLTRSGTTTTAPNNTGASTDNPDWNNTADISQYYLFGNLIPASSTNGSALYYTPDATGNGSTVKATGARYYNALASGGMATVHAKTSTEKTSPGHANNDKWEGYTKQAGYAVGSTNDDGYYVDIPVWFRTSSKSPVNLTVQALAIADADTGATAADAAADGDLYKAVRVAVIQTTGSDQSQTTTTNMIAVADTSFGGTSVYDWSNLGSSSAQAVASIASEGGAATYGNPTVYNNGATTVGTTAVITVPAATTANYGASAPATIRVWLEGEDGECINPNAAQDWDISLKFTKIESNS